MEIPPDYKMGDFAIPCFSFAKIMHKNPSIIANEVKEALESCKEELGLSSIEAVNGYCNLFVNREKYVEIVLNNLKEDNSSVEKIGLNKTICIDFYIFIILHFEKKKIHYEIIYICTWNIAT